VQEDRSKSVLVFDVGGSHISAAVCDYPGFALHQVVRASLPVRQSPDAFVDVIAEAASQAATGMEMPPGASLAIAGPFEYEAGISRMRHKLEYLYGYDLREAIASRFHCAPHNVRFLNDAAAFMFGEVHAGAVKGVARAVGLTLGTGIGSGYAIDGEIVTTGVGVPKGGEIWDFPYRGGIVEDVISTRAIQASYERLTGVRLEVSEIAEAAAQNADARRVFEEFGRDLGTVVKSTMADFAPHAVVIGGGIARSSQLFLPTAQPEVDALGIRLVIASLMDNAPLVGAGVKWMKDSGERF